MDIVFYVVCAVELLALAMCVGFAILGQCRRGFVRAAYSTGITVTALIVSLLITHPVALFFGKVLAGLSNSIIYDVSNGVVNVAKITKEFPLLADFLSNIPALFIAPVIFVLLFLLLELIGTIILTVIQKKETAKGSKHFTFKFKCSKLCAATLGIVSGLILFLVISSPFYMWYNMVSGTSDIAQNLIESNLTGDTSYEISDLKLYFQYVDLFDKTPGKTVYNTLAGKTITNRLSLMTLSGQNVSIMHEIDEFEIVVDDVNSFINNYATMESGEKADLVTSIGTRLGNSDLFTIVAAEGITYFAENLMENEIGELAVEEAVDDPGTQKLLKALAEEWKGTTQHNVKQDISFVTNVLADLCRNDFDGLIFRTEENDVSIGDPEDPEAKKKQEEAENQALLEYYGLLTRMCNADFISNLFVQINENDRMRRILPDVLNVVLQETGKELHISENDLKSMCVSDDMKNMTAEEARDLGNLVEEMFLSFDPLLKSYENMMKNSEGKTDQEKFIEILDNTDFDTLSDVLDRIIHDKYLSTPLKKLFEKCLSAFAGSGIDISKILSGETTLKDLVASIKKLYALKNKLADDNKTVEEKQTIVKDYLDNVSSGEATQISCMITPEFIKSLFGTADSISKSLAKMVSTMYNELSRVPADDTSETAAVSDLMMLAMTYQSGKDMFGENSTLGSADAFVRRMIQSKVISNTVKETIYENGELVDDPIHMGKALNASDKAMLNKAMDKYEANHDLSDEERTNIENLRILLALNS